MRPLSPPLRSPQPRSLSAGAAAAGLDRARRGGRTVRGPEGGRAGPRPSHQPAPAPRSRSTDTLAAEGATRDFPSPFSAGAFMSSSRVSSPCPQPGQQVFEEGPGRPGSSLGYRCQQYPTAQTAHHFNSTLAAQGVGAGCSHPLTSAGLR